MRRKILFGSLAGTALAAVGLLVLLSSSRSNARFGLPEGGKTIIDPLPITHMVLFNSGVGYVQREGEVDGDANIDLMFNTADINDLLKSMVLEDLGGGKVSVVSYDSSDPVDKILRSFALDLTSNPTFGQILNQARGEKIEATLKATSNAPQSALKGTIIGMEVRKSDPEKHGAAVDIDYLNLLGDSGVKSVPLNQIEQVRFLSPMLEKEFQEALRVLASSHDVQKKRVTLSFKGAGKRKVRLGYVVEKPIWKMTYRLRMEPKQKLFLQGWALVENTSDNDWTNVQMTLVSGKPISFKMDLYEPLYIPRPTVEPDLFASLRPPVYDVVVDPSKNPGLPGGMPPVASGNYASMAGLVGIGGQVQGGFQIGGFQPIGGGFQIGGIQPIGGGFQIGGIQPIGGGFQIGGFQPGGFAQFGGISGQFNGNPGNPLMNAYQNQALLQQLQQQDQGKKKLTYDELLKNKEKLQQEKDKAKQVGEKVLGMNFKEGIQSVATAEDIGDYFQYRLDNKVTLSRKRSAMLPVFNNTVEGQKVSIYNRSIHKRFPLLGLRFKNTTDHPLTQGPVTVFDESNYAGDSRVLDVQPAEERLLSYAMDLGTKIFVNFKTVAGPKMTFKIGPAHLTAKYTNEKTTKYLIKNDSKHDRLILVEHPLDSAWKLVEPAKPAAKTPNHYRFEVAVAKGKTLTFEVKEAQERSDTLQAAAIPTLRQWYAFDIDARAEIKTIPASKMAFKIGTDQLTATYLNRRTTKYVVKNESEMDRVVTLEHPLEQDWKLVQPAKADAKTPGFLELELKIAKGKSATVEVLEEQQRVDPVALLTSNKGTPMYSVAAGITVKPVTKSSLAQLVDVKIVKGILHVRNKVTESKTYFVQNASEQARTFVIDHLIRPAWTLIDPDGKDHPGPGVYHTELDVKAGETQLQFLTEEKTTLVEYGALKEQPRSWLQGFLANPIVAKAVHQALAKEMQLHEEQLALQNKLTKLGTELTNLTNDQARLRDNLKIIPQNSDPYKQFLAKFVKMELQIEELQQQVRDAQNALEKKSNDYETYVKTLNAG